MRRIGWAAAVAAGLALGTTTAVVARDGPAYAFANSAPTAAAELIAGYALIGAGFAVIHRGQRRFGALLAASGAGWFLLEWNNPGAGKPLIFAVGLVLYASAAPLVAHAVLASAPLPLTRPERAALAGAYAAALIFLGVLPALVFAPGPQGCSQCPANLLLVESRSALYRELNEIGIWLALVSVLLVIGLAAWRVFRSTVAGRRRIAPITVAGSAYLSFVAADLWVSVSRGYLSNDPVDRQLWVGEAVALVLLAGTALAPFVRERNARATLAQLVVELAAAPVPGQLEPALAARLGDPGLKLAYQLSDGRHVDSDGRPVEAGPMFTTLARDGADIALLKHRPGLLDDSALADQVASTARLALDHERLHAELLAQVADLRTSRARLIATADAQRRRLERDLHDGAQQRLVSLALGLRLARLRLEASGGADAHLFSRVEQAESELRAALADLRSLANGIFPAVLADEGLAAAIQALSEETPGSLLVSRLPHERFAVEVESVAYRIVSDVVADASPVQVRLAAFRRDGKLVMELAADRDLGPMDDIADRVGALDGCIERSCADGAARIHAEIPCES